MVDFVRLYQGHVFSYGNDYPLLCIFLQIPLQGKALSAHIFPFHAEGSSATPAAPVCLLSVEKATAWAGWATTGNKEEKQAEGKEVYALILQPSSSSRPLTHILSGKNRLDRLTQGKLKMSWVLESKQTEMGLQTRPSTGSICGVPTTFVHVKKKLKKIKKSQFQLKDFLGNYNFICVMHVWEMWFVEVWLFEKVFIKAGLMGNNSVKLSTEQFKWILSLLPPEENPVQRKLFRNEFPFYCFIEKQQWQLQTLHERHSINLNQLVQKNRQAEFVCTS